MDYALMEICRYFAAARPRGTPLVLATVLRTEGSTYRKRGASILIGADGPWRDPQITKQEAKIPSE